MLPGLLPVSEFLAPGTEAFSTTRRYSRVNRAQLFEPLGITPADYASVKQVHGAGIVVISKAQSIPPQDIEADALVTDAPGLWLSILTADCIPAFFYDPGGPAAGIAHAGWRGLGAGILEKTALTLNRVFGSPLSALRIAFGPAIRPCCYEVGAEFKEYFPAAFSAGPAPGKGMMDLLGEARRRLEAAGLSPEHIRDTGICTACSNERFFSARRGDSGERIISLIRISALSRP